MSTAYIGLGSNLDDPPERLRLALSRLAEVDGVEVVAVSPFYRTAPIGPPGQSDYCNAVARLDAALDPDALFDAMCRIERADGRERGVKWGPRRIDLDLLLFDDVTREDARLTLPHPQMQCRNFVMIPLRDLAPDVAVPGHGRADALAAALGSDGVALWDAAVAAGSDGRL